MRLCKTTNDAVRILVDCARSGDDLVKVAEISDRLGITPQNTFKIVHLLSRAGFVSAVRGRYGGVRLAAPAADIRVGQVVRAIEETASAARREKALGGEDFDQMVGDALEAFIQVLDANTIADMAETSARAAKPTPVCEPQLDRDNADPADIAGLATPDAPRGGADKAGPPPGVVLRS
ncbi:MAG: Rrf2 family transcriptional regulator [Pseudomonadota bacterium]